MTTTRSKEPGMLGGLLDHVGIPLGIRLTVTVTTGEAVTGTYLGAPEAVDAQGRQVAFLHLRVEGRSDALIPWHAVALLTEMYDR